MIRKLKRRFIFLAMASLTMLLTFIVAGMNIINYNTVINEADETLEMLSSNRGRLPAFFDEDFQELDEIFSIPDVYSNQSGDGASDSDGGNDEGADTAAENSGNAASGETADTAAESSDSADESGGTTTYRRGVSVTYRSRKVFLPKGMTRDKAEGNRFFSVLIDSNGEVELVDVERIFAVDEEQAEEYAKTVMKRGRKTGFSDEYRYMVTEEDNATRVTFLDCEQTLDSYRQFLYASIIMSVVGLIAVFLIMCYFAARIVKPVAESYEKQKRFITDAGHEIKTPLAIIKANIDVMRMDLEDLQDAEGSGGSISPSDSAESLNESLSDIDGQVDRLTSLTNDLVYLSRMEESGAALTMSEIPISDIVEETASSFDALAAEKNKTLDIEVEPMLSMQGSHKELEKLVSILVENAIKYSVEEDRIGISLKKDGKNIVLEVSNKAEQPLSDEDLEHVFDRFYRADKSRSSALGGHGIGLSMASAITAAHSGKIAARSGDGSQFIVTATMPAG